MHRNHHKSHRQPHPRHRDPSFDIRFTQLGKVLFRPIVPYIFEVPSMHQTACHRQRWSDEVSTCTSISSDPSDHLRRPAWTVLHALTRAVWQEDSRFTITKCKSARTREWSFSVKWHVPGYWLVHAALHDHRQPHFWIPVFEFGGEGDFVLEVAVRPMTGASFRFVDILIGTTDIASIQRLLRSQRPPPQSGSLISCEPHRACNAYEQLQPYSPKRPVRRADWARLQQPRLFAHRPGCGVLVDWRIRAVAGGGGGPDGKSRMREPRGWGLDVSEEEEEESGGSGSGSGWSGGGGPCVEEEFSEDSVYVAPPLPLLMAPPPPGFYPQAPRHLVTPPPHEAEYYESEKPYDATSESEASWHTEYESEDSRSLVSSVSTDDGEWHAVSVSSFSSAGSFARKAYPPAKQRFTPLPPRPTVESDSSEGGDSIVILGSVSDASAYHGSPHLDNAGHHQGVWDESSSDASSSSSEDGHADTYAGYGRGQRPQLCLEAPPPPVPKTSARGFFGSFQKEAPLRRKPVPVVPIPQTSASNSFGFQKEPSIRRKPIPIRRKPVPNPPATAAGPGRRREFLDSVRSIFGSGAANTTIPARKPLMLGAGSSSNNHTASSSSQAKGKPITGGVTVPPASTTRETVAVAAPANAETGLVLFGR